MKRWLWFGAGVIVAIVGVILMEELVPDEWSEGWRQDWARD